MGRKRRSRAAPAAEQVNAERVDAQRRRRQKLVITWSIIIVSLVLVGALVYSLWPRPSPYVGFAQCLTAKGAAMYGTDWCSHCQSQKRQFGVAFKEIAYVNCDYSLACQEQNVTGYPTWILADGTRLEGEQPLGLLGEKTGCALPRT
jgi:hypothetical protein